MEKKDEARRNEMGNAKERGNKLLQPKLECWLERSIKAIPMRKWLVLRQTQRPQISTSVRACPFFSGYRSPQPSRLWRYGTSLRTS